MLAISGDSTGLARALGDIQRQSLAEIEILLIPNGADRATRTRVDRFAASDDRIRVITMDRASLPVALNEGLREARAPLVARMDADDACTPDRLARQVAFLATQPQIAALGCAWEVVDADGRALYTVRPPVDPRRLAWKLLTGNQLAHGSMMLRRDAILALGGYDETCAKGQDYELWLRVADTLAVAALPDVLYRYSARKTDGLATSQEQAMVAAQAMLDAWQHLPTGHDRAVGGRTGDGLCEIIAHALLDDDQTGAAMARLDRHLDVQGPSRLGLLAHLWLGSRTPPATRGVIEVCRRSRLREVGRSLREDQVSSVWLFGAGSHTRWLLEHRDELGLGINGLIDEALAGTTRLGFEVRTPAACSPGQTVLISSDAFEEQIWASCEPLREAGVRVVRLYAG